MDFYRQKNIEFYDFLNENFKISKSKRWSDISENITKAKISATYKFFSKLFPLNIDYSEKLSSHSNQFRSIHYNKLNPNRIISEVVRYSLYSDEIVVFHPLQNPSITSHKLSPIKNPKAWLQNFMDSLYFYIVLQKWVRAGIVHLIVNPYEFDFKLRDRFDNEARERVSSILSTPEYEKIIMDQTTEDMAESLIQLFKGKSLINIKQGLLDLENPRFTESEADSFAQTIFSKQHLLNPLYEKLHVPSDQNSIIANKGGGNLESILYIANLLKGNIYTTERINWFQISQLEKVDFWTKVAHSYSKIELPFINDVDTSFALKLREEDRLSGVRNELRKIYGTINSTPSKEITEQLLRDLNGSFIEEIRKSDAEWSYIKKDAQNKRLYWAATTIGMPVIINQVSLLPIILGSSVWLGSNIRDEKLKLKKYKSSNPLSVFVDLQHNDPSFFSELKNCIF